MFVWSIEKYLNQSSANYENQLSSYLTLSNNNCNKNVLYDRFFSSIFFIYMHAFSSSFLIKKNADQLTLNTGIGGGSRNHSVVRAYHCDENCDRYLSVGRYIKEISGSVWKKISKISNSREGRIALDSILRSSYLHTTHTHAQSSVIAQYSARFGA